MSEMLRIGVLVALYVGLVHIQELGEKLHGRLRTDVQGFHDGYREGG